jgi:tripartite ATP-independent transporter DctM subunit
MNPIIVGVIGLIALFGLLALGLPVGVGMGVVGFGGLWYLISQGASMAKMGLTPFSTVCSWDLAVLPLFILMANIVSASGITRGMYDMAAKWLGHRRGGLAMATVAGSAWFAAVSASSLATAVTMGSVAIPEMKRYKYDPGLSMGCVAAGGTMGQLIPPSGALIIYGLITETSIGRLFMAGIVPGLTEAILYIIAIQIVCTLRPSWGPRGATFSFREKVASFKGSGEMIVLVVLLFLGIYLGWFTPTEAGAVGAAAALLISLVRRRLNWENFKCAVVDTMKITGMLYGIVIGAYIFKYFLAVTTIPFVVADYVAALPLSPMGIMWVIFVVYLILGCLMDALAMQLLTLPIFFPLVVALGFDPIWFGIFVVVAIEIGLITPPIGMNVYAIAGMFPEVPITTAFRGVIPFLIADITRVVILMFIPATALFLPSLMMR